MRNSAYKSRYSTSEWKRATILLLLFVFLFTPSLCRAWQGKVIAVANGDTLTVLHDGKKEQIRVYGIECPAKEQDSFQHAKQFTAAVVSGRTVEIEPRDRDRFARPLAIITVEGRNLGRELVRAGLAWVHIQDRKRPEYRDLEELEKQAKIAGTGLWAVHNPIPPWEFKPGKAQNPVYSGDVLTHRFHATNCPDYNCKSCIATFKDRSKAIAAGYTPCPECKP
jgi:endonuclease YncB( thermonuclease family)